ncbi:RagB/SusD family nutrient uptake outer membrane protein [Pedobacter sp. MC2016-14]|uniref:RagB/SusD family nutrient uptake outer membrane protein n=1 Tax=Pedobacter sp. MC2016-14 TaxID=2897327 RepID=UPI001E3ACA2C|nr:RagB/SusD family nutrient uptake outer membrane protein [Pedobacter sp. MC2016-14]MCD0490340.1 RagB/SusD family nutrient uptake outer membrane protein [Pedobacter sp. MC2016-14]
MKNTIILIFVLGIFLAGCEKRLEVTPPLSATEQEALSSVDGMDAALAWAYSGLHGHLSTRSIMYSELMADHLNYTSTGTVVEMVTSRYYYARDREAIINDEGSSAAGSQSFVASKALGNLYRSVTTVGLVIRGVERGYADADVTFPVNRDRILGESYFIRAATYFDIVRFYARAWGATADNSHPGIVLNDDAVVDRESQIKPRATVAQVYESVINDLIKAEQLLPAGYNPAIHPPAYQGRTYKDAARALLARVYFQQQNYGKAKEVIDRLIGATPGEPSNHPLETGDITDVFSRRGINNINPESIFQTTSSLDVNATTTYWNTNNGAFGVAPTTVSQARVTPSFISDTHHYSTDVRYTLLLRPGTTGLIPNKYSKAGIFSFNLPLIRTAEMLLDRAEVNVLANNLSDAVADINAIRKRAYGYYQLQTQPEKDAYNLSSKNIPLTITQSALLDTIRVERIRELAFEGDRLWNLKRIKQAIPPGERVGASPLPWDGNELVLKYSFLEMNKNPLLVNN